MSEQKGKAVLLSLTTFSYKRPVLALCDEVAIVAGCDLCDGCGRNGELAGATKM